MSKKRLRILSVLAQGEGLQGSSNVADPEPPRSLSAADWRTGDAAAFDLGPPQVCP